MKLIHKEWIFTDPAPTPECHASTLARLPDGSLAAAWFGGEKEGKPDVRIWTSVKKNGVWSQPVAVTENLGIPHWNPVLFFDGNKLNLFYKRGLTIPHWVTYARASADGVNWNEEVCLVPEDTSGGRGPVKNKAIRTCSGKILAPASTEQGAWRPFVDISTDGWHWEKHPIPVEGENAQEINLIQPTLWEYPEGKIHALMRSNQGWIYRSDSEDDGETWSPAYPTDMPNNNSGIDCVMTDAGILVLVCNPIAADWGKRRPLSVFVSSDNGEHFRHVMDLETQDGEFSYPAIIAHEDRLFISYTHKRTRIACCELQLQAGELAR